MYLPLAHGFVYLEAAYPHDALVYYLPEQWVRDNDSIWRQQLLANDSALEEHHWGVPTMVFQGEPFFGQDKIELLLWRMQQKGLEKLGRTHF